MNYTVLHQLEENLSAHLPIPSLSSWQQANVALFSYGVIEAEAYQQRQIARKVSCGEQNESAAAFS